MANNELPLQIKVKPVDAWDYMDIVTVSLMGGIYYLRIPKRIGKELEWESGTKVKIGINTLRGPTDSEKSVREFRRGILKQVRGKKHG